MSEGLYYTLAATLLLIAAVIALATGNLALGGALLAGAGGFGVLAALRWPSHPTPR